MSKWLVPDRCLQCIGGRIVKDMCVDCGVEYGRRVLKVRVVKVVRFGLSRVETARLRRSSVNGGSNEAANRQRIHDGRKRESDRRAKLRARYRDKMAGRSIGDSRRGGATEGEGTERGLRGGSDPGCYRSIGIFPEGQRWAVQVPRERGSDPLLDLFDDVA